MTTIHRTVRFRVCALTPRDRAALEHALRVYCVAYTTLLYDAAQYSRDHLRGLATWALDEQSGAPRQSARMLTANLYHKRPLSPAVAAALAPLPSRLLQSVKEHVGCTSTCWRADHTGETRVQAQLLTVAVGRR
jgi:hypothetical protein